MKLTFKITGARELNSMLQQLPPYVARQVAGNALRAGARVIQADAKRRAPVGPDYEFRFKDYAEPAVQTKGATPGQLRNAIRVRTDPFKGGTIRKVVVVVSNKRAGINPHWIEYGTAATRTAKTPGGLMTFVIDGKLIRKRSVKGIKADPFMRPAADTQWQEAVNVIGREIGKGIESAAIRLGSTR
jgi:HK97 gp10 family phage protein